MTHVGMWFNVERRHPNGIWHIVGLPMGTQVEAMAYRAALLKSDRSLPGPDLRVAITTVEVAYQEEHGNSDIVPMSDMS